MNGYEWLPRWWLSDIKENAFELLLLPKTHVVLYRYQDGGLSTLQMQNDSLKDIVRALAN
jgi:hypothetical protein